MKNRQVNNALKIAIVAMIMTLGCELPTYERSKFMNGKRWYARNAIMNVIALQHKATKRCYLINEGKGGIIETSPDVCEAERNAPAEAEP